MIRIFWLEQSAREVPVTDDWLGAAEQLNCARLRVPKRRADWRLGRWTAKLAVAQHLEMPRSLDGLAGIEVRAAASGAPEVFLDGNPVSASISISHRAGMAACALTVSGSAIGCDLELVEPRSDAFAADYFTEAERLLLRRMDPAERALSTTLLWSAKESAMKALKVGLRLDTNSFEVTFGPESSTSSAEAFDRGQYPSLCFASTEVRNCHQATLTPLRVTSKSGATFVGCWWCADRLVRTVVAA